MFKRQALVSLALFVLSCSAAPSQNRTENPGPEPVAEEAPRAPAVAETHALPADAETRHADSTLRPIDSADARVATFRVSGLLTKLPVASASPEDARCRRLLGRFGPEAIEAEQEDCVETFTTSRELAGCRERGLGEDYISCVESCMRSIDLGRGGYVPGDAVGNCRGPCHQVTCTDESF